MQFAELGKLHLPLDRDLTLATALADLDGDGDLDLVAGNYGQSRIYLNDGIGTYVDVTAAHMPRADCFTECLAVGDVDGDGDLDLVLSDYTQIRLYLNGGNGTFTDVTARNLPPLLQDRVFSLVLGDVDGDGDLDLLAGTAWQDRLLLNSGNGSFTDVTTTNMPIDPGMTRALALGDVDGDGDLDLVAGRTEYRDEQDRLYTNNGAGVFTDATAAHMPFDNDRTTTSLAFADLDRDGDLDLLVGSAQSKIYLNDGSGTFVDATATRMPIGEQSPAAVAIGDVDGDGDLDLVLGCSYAASRLLLNNGSGTFTDATANMPTVREYTTSTSLGDVDGDGDLDLVLGSSHDPGQRTRLYLNSGSGTFVDAAAAPLPPTFDGSGPVAFADVDGDRDLDLILGNVYHCCLLRNEGRGQFVDITANSLPVRTTYTTAVALADVDADGDVDLVVGGLLDWIRLYLNDGSGAFTDVTTARMPLVYQQTSALAFGDVDIDGDLDLVVGIRDAPCRLYLNNGAGTFVDGTTGRLPNLVDRVTSIALADFDRDGDLDLVVGSFDHALRYYANNSLGAFVDVTASRMQTTVLGANALVFGDLDRDGDLDLVVARYGGNRLLENDNLGNFIDSSGHLPVLNETGSSLVLGDIDNDRDLDLIVGNSPSFGHGNRCYLNNGAGIFADVTDQRMPGAVGRFTRALALGDVDGDGDLDLAISGPAICWLFQNLQRQLDTPYLLRSGRDYRLDVYARYGPPRLFDVALPYFALTTANIPVPPLGTIGIDLATAVALPPFLIPQPAGVGSLTIPVPSVPTLAGLPVHLQALLVQYPTQERLTNVITDTIVR